MIIRKKIFLFGSWNKRILFFAWFFFYFFIHVSLSQTSGPLQKHPANPRYFADAHGKIVYLTGSHTWSNFQDNGNGNPPPTFDWIGYIEWMKSLNHNFLRLWTWEETRWTSETWDNDYWFNPQSAYVRTGPGTALDGLPKFNLDNLDDSYFQRMRTRVIEAGQRGIYVSIMLFNGWSVTNRLGHLQPFNGSPFKLSNNINGVNGDADGDGDGEETHSLQDPVVNNYQYTYVKRVIDAVNDLDNVLFEISNESPYAGSDEWSKRMVDTIHAYELLKPKQHPVGYTGDWGIPNNNLWTSNADWISPGAGNNGSAYQNDPPAGDGSKVVITDSDHLWGVGGNRIWVWKSFTRGLNPIFMDGYDGKSYGCGGVNFDSSNTTWVSFRKNMGYTRTFANRMNLTAMTPQNSLSSTTYCLANPAPTGAEYLIYCPTASGTFSVNLSSTSGNLNVEWFNPETGLSLCTGTIAGGTVQNFSAPFSCDAVLYLSSVGNGPLPSGTFQSTVSTLPVGGGQATLMWTSDGATYAEIDQGISTVALNGNVVVNVTSTTTYTLRLYNLNGTTLLPVTVAVSSPPPPSNHPIYSENVLSSPWNDIRSWSVTRNYANSNPVFQGSTSARIEHRSWAALQFSKGSWGAFINTDPSIYQSLDFSIHGGSAGVTLYVSCISPSGSNILSPVSFTVPANTWQTKSIPMNQLANVPFMAVYLTAKGSNVTFYLDNISLVLKPAGPEVPVIVSPGNNSINQSTSPMLSWAASAGATTYHLQLALDSLFSNLVINDSILTGTSRNVSSLTNLTNYYWRVSAKNAEGTSAYSPTWKFTTIISAPTPPSLVLPTDNNVNTILPITFTWIKPQSATGFTLHIATDPSFGNIVLNDTTLTDSIRVVTSLQFATTYFWRVRAKNIGGVSEYSISRSFTTSVAPPASPTLVQPVNNQSNQPINLELIWNASPNAVSYRVQLASDSFFVNLVIDQSTITETSIQVSSLLYLTKYYWRVSATNAGGTNGFSGCRTFTTVIEPLGTPTLVSPANNSIEQPTSSWLTWTRVPNANEYYLHMYDDSTLSHMVVNIPVTDTAMWMWDLDHSKHYFWRVHAYNSSGSGGEFSEIFNFKTIIPENPGPAQLVFPDSVENNLPLRVQFKWNSTYATTYHFLISTDSTFSYLGDNPPLDSIYNYGNGFGTIIADTTVIVDSLSYGTKYYWMVNTPAINYAKYYSQIWSFTTMEAPDTIAPLVTITTPLHNSFVSDTILIAAIASDSVGIACVQFKIEGVNFCSVDSLSPYCVQLNTIEFSDGSYSITATALDSAGNISTSQAVTVTVANGTASSDTLKIMPFGDSITECDWQGGYRSKLYKMLSDSGFCFDFVGRKTTNHNDANLGFAFPQNYWDHEGYIGRAIFPTWLDSVRAAINANMPDIILIIMGTNDAANGTRSALQIRNYLNSLLDSIWAFNPNIKVVLSNIPRIVPGTLFSQHTLDTIINTNVLLPQLVEEKIQLGRYIVFIDNFNALNESSDFTGDGVHPSTSGYDKMKHVWYPAVVEALTNNAVSTIPKLISPANGSINASVSPTLKWSAVPGEQVYHLQIATDILFDSTVQNIEGINATQYAVNSFLPNTKYFWRVRSADTTESGNYSVSWNFTTGSIPTLPALISPLNNAENIATSVMLQWQSSSSTTNYHLQVSDDSLFTSLLINDSTIIDTVHLANSLYEGTQYYWRVRGMNILGTSSFSAPWKFTTNAFVPPSVNYIYQENSLSSPWNDVKSWSIVRTYASTNPVFTGITSYRITHSPWAALQITQGTWGAFVNIDPTPYQSLDFAVHGGTTGVTLYVNCTKPTGGSIFTPISFVVPANTWQVKSIPMSQLANVPFLSIYFTAKGSTVTFSLDNVGLTYQQGSTPSSKEVPYERVLADFSNDGIIDGRDIALFVSAMKINDFSKADIGPAEGTAPNLLLQGDGIIDSKDFNAFADLWKWAHNNLFDSKNNAIAIGENCIISSAINVSKRTEIKISKKQRFKIQLPEITDVHTLQLSLRYNPSSVHVENILIPDAQEDHFHLKNIENNSGYSVAVVSSMTSTLIHELLATNVFEIELAQQTAFLNDSIEVQVQAFNDTSVTALLFRKKISLNELLIPKEYGLEQNFPNPFNPTTTIRYLLPEKSKVSIEVFNALGQSVVKLVDKEIDAGIEEVVWRANTSSGMYFYRLHATSVEDPKKSFVETKKMILLK